MYRRKPQGWVKHIDFILLDLMSLALAFILALISRHGADSVHLIQYYMGILFFYLLTAGFLHVVNNTFCGVMKRGYYKEFSHTVKHVAVAELAAITYLFSVQQTHPLLYQH